MSPVLAGRFFITEPPGNLMLYAANPKNSTRIKNLDLINEFSTIRREVAQSCPTLCDPMDCSPPGSSVHGIFQAWILEWVAISFSRGCSRPRDWTRVSRIVGRCFTIQATREAHASCKSYTKAIHNNYASIYTNKEQSRNETKKTIPLTADQK